MKLKTILIQQIQTIPAGNALLAGLKHIRAYPAFVRDFKMYQRLASANTDRFTTHWNERRPFLNDKTAHTGFDRHYIYHPAWAARVLARTRPALHIDISSTLHFCTIVSAFIPVKFYDYRPANLHLSNLSSDFADLLALPFADNSVASLSCMHTIEHVGLGRYGDPIDPDADLKAIAELKRVLAPGGSLLFVTPIGKPRVVFNAHRIYAYDQVLSYFADLTLKEFALVPDQALLGGLLLDAPKGLADEQSYGCGCFWFVKQQ
jgi:SAM-dependent methyltransferase